MAFYTGPRFYALHSTRGGQLYRETYQRRRPSQRDIEIAASVADPGTAVFLVETDDRYPANELDRKEVARAPEAKPEPPAPKPATKRKRRKSTKRSAAEQRRRQTGMGFEETGFALVAEEAPERPPTPPEQLPPDPRQTRIKTEAKPVQKQETSRAATGGVVEQRRQLRAEATQRRKQVLPKLRKAIAAARRAKTQRLRECKRIAADRRRRVQRASVAVERELRKRIERTRSKAQAAAKQCTVRAAREGTAKLEQALAALEAERQEIARLQQRATALRSERGRKGGRRAAELRAESDDRVRNEIGNDPIMLAVFDRVKGKIKGSKHMSRSEAFFEHLHKHPELLDEERARSERKWEAEAAELLGAQHGALPTTPDELRDCLDMLTKCERHCGATGAPAPF